MNTWAILLIIICVSVVLLGFLGQLGYEFSKFRSILTRTPYLSYAEYQIALESKGWTVSKQFGKASLSLSGSYPKVVSFIPLLVFVETLNVSYRDEYEPVLITDYSAFNMNLPTVHHWVKLFIKHFLRLLTPVVQFGVVSSTYSYRSTSMETVQFESNLDHVRVHLKKRVLEIDSLSCKRFDSGAAIGKRKVLSVTVPSWSECVYRDFFSEGISYTCDSVLLEGFQHRTLTDLFEEFSVERRTDSMLVPSQFGKLNVKCVVRQTVSCQVHFPESHLSIETLLEASRWKSGGLSTVVSPSSTSPAGIFLSVLIDPFSLTVFSFSMHNFTNQRARGGLRASLKLLQKSVPLASLHLFNSSLSADYDENRWSISGRVLSVVLSVLSSSDNLVHAKQVSVVGSESKGLSFLSNSLEVDASPRMVNKVVRVWQKMAKLVETTVDTTTVPTPPLTPQTCSTPPTPHTPLFLISDPNYLRLQQRFLTSPISSSRAGLALTGVKNWRSMERFMHDANGKVLLNLAIDRIQVRDQANLGIHINKLKLVSKVSPMGTPFTAVNIDQFAVNDNIQCGGGFRIWIDGHLTSAQARVFCLIPPIAIRFDSKFAAIVERYLLEIAEILKMISSSAKPTSTSTTLKFIEFLQISSLPLELHAKEMLGLLSLDKAMINLSRSSVYQSNGVVDAVNSLASQYREEIVGQWLSLLMRLDVSIGRPVTTARKIFGGITNLFRKENSLPEFPPSPSSN